MGLEVTVCVGTYGDMTWWDLARRRALPSSVPQATHTVHIHADDLATARNVAADRAQTEWLCFLDGDDELEPGYMDAMAQGTADLRGPAVRYVGGGGLEHPRVWPEQDLREGNHLVIGTLIRKVMFQAVGGFREFPLYEDWDLWQRCWKAGASIETIPSAIYQAHVRDDSRNRAPDRHEREHWHHEIRRANFPELYAEAA